MRANGASSMSWSRPATFGAAWCWRTCPSIHRFESPPITWIDSPASRLAIVIRLEPPVAKSALWLASCWMLKPTAAIANARLVHATAPQIHDETTRMLT